MNLVSPLPDSIASRQNSIFSRQGSIYRRPSSAGSRDTGRSTRMEDIMDMVETEKSQQVIKMVLVIMLPVLALVAKAGILFESALSTYRDTTVLDHALNRTIRTSQGIHLIQVERGLTAVFLGSGELGDFQRLARARLETNQFLQQYTSLRGIKPKSAGKLLKTGTDIMNHLQDVRGRVDQKKSSSTIDVIDIYTEVTMALNQETVNTKEVPSRKVIWPLVVAYSALSKAIDVVGIQRALGGVAFTSCSLPVKTQERFIQSDSEIQTFLEIAFRSYPEFNSVFNETSNDLGDLPELIASRKKVIVDPEALSEVCDVEGRSSNETLQWFKDVSDYIVFWIDLELKLTREIELRLPALAGAAAGKMGAYLTVMVLVTTICLILCIWYSLKLNEMMQKMKKYGNDMKKKTEEVEEEKKKTDFLLYQMMPKKVAHKLVFGMEVAPESYDSVTVYFSDIVGWANMSNMLTPHGCVQLLNDLYRSFDDVLEKFDVYKVETIADSYMVVSGLPEPNGIQHIAEIGDMALTMMDLAKSYKIRNVPGATLNLRIGFHSGHCVAGIVGTKMPRYCLFGDTVNTASRMETNGQAMRIHVSASAKQLMDQKGGFETEHRGRITIKGKGEMDTYWLISYNSPRTKQQLLMDDY